MNPATIAEVVARSPADSAGLVPGDAVLAINGNMPRDVIEYQQLIDDRNPEVIYVREGLRQTVVIEKSDGEPAGIRFGEALFDGVRHCDNRCEFCFVYQLPDGMRASLYEKDDDYRLSFLYGNFTTLTRFGDDDFRRVVRERISPLYVSLHTTNAQLRARMLKNKKAARSLAWLRPLLDAGIDIHAQVVLCPRWNDREELDRTLMDIGETWPEISSVGVVPVGIARYYRGDELVPADGQDMADVVERIGRWQKHYLERLGRRLVFASDEIYLGAGADFPPAEDYEDFPQYENGVGMARCLIDEAAPVGSAGWESLDAAPGSDWRPWGTGNHAVRAPAPNDQGSGGDAGKGRKVVITGELGSLVLGKALAGEIASGCVELLPVANEFFGGNIGVTGLLTGLDVAKAIEMRCDANRGSSKTLEFLLPEVVIPQGRMLDGVALRDLRSLVNKYNADLLVVPVSGKSLRSALRASSGGPDSVIACSGATT